MADLHFPPPDQPQLALLNNPTEVTTLGKSTTTCSTISHIASPRPITLPEMSEVAAAVNVWEKIVAQCSFEDLASTICCDSPLGSVRSDLTALGAEDNDATPTHAFNLSQNPAGSDQYARRHHLSDIIHMPTAQESLKVDVVPHHFDTTTEPEWPSFNRVKDVSWQSYWSPAEPGNLGNGVLSGSEDYYLQNSCSDDDDCLSSVHSLDDDIVGEYDWSSVLDCTLYLLDTDDISLDSKPKLVPFCATRTVKLVNVINVVETLVIEEVVC